MLLLLIILTTSPTFSQPYYFRHYQVEEGLSNNTVFCSVQGRNGFMWFGTKNGLNRFDGYQFKQFTIADNNQGSGNSDMIYCLSADMNGALWVGSAMGLYRFDEKKEKLVSFIDSLKEVNTVLHDVKGRLWFISWNTVYRYDFGNSELVSYQNLISATSICRASNNTLWFGSTDGKLYRYNESQNNFSAFELFSHSPAPPSRWIQKVRCTDDGSILIGTSGQGLKLFDTATLRYTDLLTENPNRTPIYIRDILLYDRNEYWLATESGIFILHRDKAGYTNLRKKFLDPYSLSDNAVYTLSKDSEGGVWAGTYFGGINYFSKQHTFFTKYYPDYSSNTVGGSAVREICEDHNGVLWIGTEDAGLNSLDKRTGAITHYEPGTSPGSISHSNIHGLLVSGNELWIGTFENGLDIMDLGTRKVVRRYKAGSGEHELKSNFVVSLLETRSGNKYVGTSNGLFRFTPAGSKFDCPDNFPAGGFISCLLEDSKGLVWIGTHGRGIYGYEPSTRKFTNFTFTTGDTLGFPNNIVNAIYEDSKNRLWFATEGGGLCNYNENQNNFTTYTTKDGLPSNFIFKIIEDDHGYLWVSTSKGLVRFLPEQKSIGVFTKANGLLNDQFNYNSGYKDADGNIYFGSIKGMVSFRPGTYHASNFVPQIFITGFQVHNRELSISADSGFLPQSILYTKSLKLPYDQSSFSIDFAALSFTSPEVTAYSYKMDGLEKEWTFLKTNRKVYFTNLSSGKYVFRVKAFTNGNWNSKEKKLYIEILPPFWASTTAYIVYALLVAVIAWLLIRRYHRRTQEKKEKEIYEAKIDFFTNVAHEIRTPLTLIKGPVENLLEKTDEIPEIREDVTMMNRNTNRLVTLITQILDFRKTETRGFSLDFAKEDIAPILEESYITFRPVADKKKLNYSLQLPDQRFTAMADEEALTKIFSNLLGNATKYASQHVSVILYPPGSDDMYWSLTVENDGPLIPAAMREKIFEPFVRIKDATRQRGTGIGLALAKSLATLHGGELLFREAENGMNLFILRLPVHPPEKETSQKPKRTAQTR
jgi:signal transduction histidine kinase/ligand-binding sensor domain-containing protein